MAIPTPMLVNTFYVHSLIQALVMGLIITLGASIPALEEYAADLNEILDVVSWPFLLVAFVLFQYPITEVILQQCHFLAYVFFSRRFLGYRILASLFNVALLYVSFVVVHCTLVLFTLGRFALDYGPVSFSEGWVATFKADWQFLGILLLGEIIRQLVFRKKIESHYRLMQEKVKEI